MAKAKLIEVVSKKGGSTEYRVEVLKHQYVSIFKDGELVNMFMLGDEATHYILSQGKDEALFKFIHLTVGELADMEKVKDFAASLQRLAEPLGHKDKVVSMLRAMLMSYSRSLISTALSQTQELGKAMGIMVLTQDIGSGASDLDESDIPEHLKMLLDMPVVGGMH